MREIGKGIIRQAKKGNGKAFRQVVEYYQHIVYRISYVLLGNSKLAEELASDTLIYAYINMERYPGKQKFSLWLFQIIVFLGKERLCDKRSVFEEDSNMATLFLNTSLEERLSIMLQSSNGLTHKEISHVLCLPAPEVFSFIWKGREAVRENFHKLHERNILEVDNPL
jgi:DNA-directed RNA polymerase specialized sigma24 family protein